MCDTNTVLKACRGHWQSPECATSVAVNGDACLGIPVFDAAGAPPVAFYVCPSSRGGSLEAACDRLGYAPAEPAAPADPPADAAPVSSDDTTFTESLLTLHPSGGQTFKSTGGFAGTAVQLGVLAGATGAYRNRQALRKFKYSDTFRQIPEAMGLLDSRRQGKRASDWAVAQEVDRKERGVAYRGIDTFVDQDDPIVYAQVEEVKEIDRRNLATWKAEQEASRARAAASAEQNTTSLWRRLFG